MFSWGLVKFFIYLSFPYIIKRFFKWIQTRSQSKSTPATAPLIPYRAWEWILLCIGILYAFMQLFLALYWIHRSNYFTNLRITSFELPSYMLRSQLRKLIDAMSAKYPQAMHEMMQCRKEQECLPESLSTCQNTYWLERPFVRLANLTELLCVAANRKKYIKHGEDAFLNCSYCTEDWDYYVYNVVGMGLSYLAFLMLAKGISHIRGKTSWFNIAVIFAFVLFAHELYHYTSPLNQLALYDSLFKHFMSATSLKLEKTETIRRVCFAIGILVMSAFDREMGGFLQHLVRINKTLEGCLKKANLLRMQKIAVNQDADLRRFQNDQVVRREHVRQSVLMDEEFSKYRKEIVANSSALLDECCSHVKASFDELERDTKEFTESDA